ncbi:hypothetical protein EZV77_30935 [Burkholderia thailandensis]|nr:hypothetical protein [Burkholderia thailandensis]MDD1486314.1 hypothetical protein [Burkholderia thailandensis]MDD1492090.1 hypothetical protein [Burkholderia thailandensis]TBW54928.1 hypothetical protein EZV77_30935 [Burkholderia thailandensis]TGB32562.1 hypothetical protein C6946_16845 [Burkholderia thailandensis]
MGKRAEVMRGDGRNCRLELGRRKSVAPKKSADIHSGPAESRMDVRLNGSGRLDGGEAPGLAPCVP